MPFPVDIVLGSKPPIRDRIWLMEPVEDHSCPKRLMTVEMPPILLRGSNRSDNMIWMDRSRADDVETNCAASPQRNYPTFCNVFASEYTKGLDMQYSSARSVIVPHTLFIMAWRALVAIIKRILFVRSARRVNRLLSNWSSSKDWWSAELRTIIDRNPNAKQTEKIPSVRLYMGMHHLSRSCVIGCVDGCTVAMAATCLFSINWLHLIRKV